MSCNKQYTPINTSIKEVNECPLVESSVLSRESDTMFYEGCSSNDIIIEQASSDTLEYNDLNQPYRTPKRSSLIEESWEKELNRNTYIVKDLKRRRNNYMRSQQKERKVYLKAVSKLNLD